MATDMSLEQKKAVVGQCNFFCLSVVTMAAWICGLTATIYCSFVGREVTFTNNDAYTSLCDQVGDSQCQTLTENHGVGFYGWQTTVPVNQLVCMSYTQYVNGVGYVTPAFDTNFNMAFASTFIANIFGGLAFFTIWLAACCPISQKRLASLSCVFFIACLFQGFTLLIFQSSICRNGFFSVYFQGASISPDSFNVTCSLDTGSNLAISATVLYFVAMITVPAATVPKPLGHGRGWDDDIGESGADPEAQGEVMEQAVDDDGKA